MKPRTIAGLMLTTAWLAGFGSFTLVGEAPIKGNEWGDWAAGMFAPVAFFWLVLGYFQQGEELRDNVRALNLQEEALRLQVQELKESVEQQTAAARAASRQADLLERSQELALRSQVLNHQPRFVSFHLRGIDEAPQLAEPEPLCAMYWTLKLQFVNWGCACHGLIVSIVHPPPVGIAVFPVRLGHVPKESGREFGLHISALPMEFVDIDLSYTDELLVHQTQRIRLETDEWRQPQELSASLEHMSFNLPKRMSPPTDGSIEQA